MTKHAFLEGMGLGVLAGAAIGMAVTAKSMQSPDVRRMARRAVRKMDHMKDDLADTLGLYAQKEVRLKSRTSFLYLTFILFMSYLI